WMSTLYDTKSIAHYNIPGTDDSTAGTIPNPSGGARTQTLNIFHQLLNGIRFIDTRLDISLRTLQCFHGILPLGITFSAVLSQIYKFLQLHPSETVIISVKREGFATDSDLWAEVAAAIKPGSEFWWNYSTESDGPGYTGLPTLKTLEAKLSYCLAPNMGSPLASLSVSSWPDNSPHAVVSLPRNSAGISEQLEFQDQCVADPSYGLSTWT
ncbi:PLC-like phosphodiesterase, partial [Lentinula aff. lateritia]